MDMWSLQAREWELNEHRPTMSREPMLRLAIFPSSSDTPTRCRTAIHPKPPSLGSVGGGLSNLFAAARDNRIRALVALDGSMRYFPALVKQAGDVDPGKRGVMRCVSESTTDRRAPFDQHNVREIRGRAAQQVGGGDSSLKPPPTITMTLRMVASYRFAHTLLQTRLSRAHSRHWTNLTSLKRQLALWGVGRE